MPKKQKMILTALIFLVGWAVVWLYFAFSGLWVPVWLGRSISPQVAPELQWKRVIQPDQLKYVLREKSSLFPVPHVEVVLDSSVCEDLKAFTNIVRSTALSLARVDLSIAPPAKCTPSQIKTPAWMSP